MASTFKMKQGDTLPVIEVTLYDDADQTTPTNLTNASAVKMIIGKKGSAPTFTATMTIDADPTTGKATYQWVSGDTEFAVGQYSLEFEVTWTGTPTDVSTYPKDGYLTFELVEDLG